MIKLIIAGGRDFCDKDYMMVKLTEWGESIGFEEGDEIELVCGMAKGADLTGKTIFDEAELPHKPFTPDWKDVSKCEPWQIGTNNYGQYNKMAGMQRNHAMGDYATHLLVFWDSRSKGTKDMIDYMNKLGKPVMVANY